MPGRTLRRCSAAPGRRFSSMNGQGRTQELMPEEAKEAIGHGIRAKRSKSGRGEL